MEITKSALWPEVQAVLNAPGGPVNFNWKAIVHINQRGADYPAMKVMAVDRLCDYENNLTDMVIVTLGIPAGVYANQIYPFQNDLDITLIQQPTTATGDQPTSGKVIARRMQATLIDNGDPQLQAQSINAANQDALDMTNFLEVQFQLLDKTMEQLRMVSIGGIWRHCNVADFLKGTLTKTAQQTKVDEALMLQGIDLLPPNNTDERDHIVIPQGTQLLDVPDYVQQKIGIYSAGMGSYVKDRHWYIYPALDLNRGESGQDHITIIVVPSNRLQSPECTYRQDPGNLVVVATGEVQFRGDSTPQQLNHGNGVRYADASKIMDGFAITDKGKTLTARGNVNSEYVTTERPNGLNNVQMSSERITANPYYQASKLARRNGSVISLLWENSNDELLKPSMAATVIYLQNDQVRTLKGVLLKTQTYVELAGPGFTASRYRQNTGLSCFVANVIN